MPRETLLDFFADLARWPGEFLVYDDGFRSWSYTYADVAGAARAFARRLEAAGLAKGDKVLVWGENRPEWIVAFWGCVLRGVVVVPIDFRASSDFLLRVGGIVGARVVLVGEDVEAPAWPEGLEAWPLEELLKDVPGAADAGAPVQVGPDDLAEIIFTSGATAEPKGVLITHRNVLANVRPIEGEVAKYRKYGKPFFPLRFLNLLPLSHMFGQSMATFVPPMLPGVVVFMRGYNPQEIIRQVRTRRVSVLVCVPKLLDVLRDHLVRAFPETAAPLAAKEHFTRRWWRYRRVHRAFGLKFWAFVVGAAPLDPALEEFMGKLGFLVIQGYGLTETAPIVTLNHPFSTRRGTVGKPIHGVEVRIAGDGEVLVRGENVTRGYFAAGGGETAGAFEDGWLHTGDVGEMDAEGRLTIKGRKKEMIVTPEGLNVFPEDVERALLGVAGVEDAAVVGRAHEGEERVHAVLVVAPGTDTQAVMREANHALADHQKVRSVSVWPSASLPRTEGTRKLKRREIRTWVESGERPSHAAGAAAAEVTLEDLLARFARGAPSIAAETTIDELGLTSLERVELLMALEERFQVTVDEAAFAEARTVGDLAALVQAPRDLPPPGATDVAGAAGAGTGRSAAPREAGEPVEFPSWNRRALPRLVRRASLPTWILPIARLFAWVRVEGLEHLRGLRGPVVFAANHQSHMDTPAILAALPARWRYRVAVAMAKEFFKPHFFPAEHGRRAWFTNSLNYYLASLFFNAFPIPQREAGARHTLRYIGELFAGGESLLIFPEGKRTRAGEINTFRAGIGMIASRLGVPVVPVRIDGLEKVLHQDWKMARPGRVRVAFGAPLSLRGEDYEALARRVEEAVRAL